MYCSCTGIRPIQLEIWPELDLAGFPEKWPDLRFVAAGAEIHYNPKNYEIWMKF